MKKRIACLAAAAALCLTACAGEGFSDNEFLSRGVARSRDTSLTFNYADGASEPPLAYNSFANTTATFGFKLLRRSYREDGNTAVMPANAILQLSLLLNGAKGDTKQEILFALGNELSADSLNTCSSYFQSRMQTVGRKYLEQQSEDGKDISPTLTIPRMLFLNDGKRQPRSREGVQEAQWILLDYGDFIVHIMHDEARDFYHLERLWRDCPQIELPLEHPEEPQSTER